jgi:hypothetical protein
MGQANRESPYSQRDSEYRECEFKETVLRVSVHVYCDADLNGRQYDAEDEPLDARRTQRICREAPITSAEWDPGT